MWAMSGESIVRNHSPPRSLAVMIPHAAFLPIPSRLSDNVAALTSASQKHNLDRHGSECPTFQKQMHMRTPPLCSSASHSPRCTVSSVALMSSKEQSGNTPEQHSAQWLFRSWFHTRKLRLDINRKALLKVLGLTRDMVGGTLSFSKARPFSFS